MAKVNLRKAFAYEEIAEFLDALSAAGATASDIEQIIRSPIAARAALLSSRIAIAPASKNPQTVPYNESQLRRILETANVSKSEIDRYSDPERFTRLISKPGVRVTPRGLEMISLIAGVGNEYDGRMTMQQLADKMGITHERVRQIISQSSRSIRMLIEFDRPPIAAQVTQGRLSDSMSELLGLLG